MARRGQGRMSMQLKMRLAQELGIGPQVQGGYFGNVSSRDCGALVRQAIEYAESILASQAAQAKQTEWRTSAR